MTKVKLAIAGVLVAVASYLIGGSDIPAKFGGVSNDSGYRYKNITSTDASATIPVEIATSSKAFMLGSIVVNTTHATVIRIYDGIATSTGTLIASLPASAVVGNYIYDVNVKKGIVLDVPAGFAGNYTITWK
jgi:hypothetical protein